MLTNREQERKSDIPDGRNESNREEVGMQSNGLYSPLHKTVPTLMMTRNGKLKVKS